MSPRNDTLARSYRRHASRIQRLLETATSWDQIGGELAELDLALTPSGKTAMRLVRNGESLSLDRRVPRALRRPKLEARLGAAMPDAPAAATESPAEMATTVKESSTGQTPPISLNVLPLDTFRNAPEPLTLEERGTLVEQAYQLLDSLYAHLPLKRAFLAVDPLQSLRLVLNRVEAYRSDTEFLEAVVAAFIDLRDLHTLFETPNPWRQFVAFLPFTLGEFVEAGQRRYLVLQIHPAYARDSFQPFVEVTHWNGTPIAEMVRLFGRSTSGANPAAERRRAISGLTLRPLSFVLPPTEDWTVLSYVDADGAPQEIRIPWQLLRLPPPAQQARANAPTQDGVAPLDTMLGVDPVSARRAEAHRRLFEPDLQARERMVAEPRRSMQAALSAPPRAATTWFPQLLSFGVLDSDGLRFGYLRVASFEVQDVVLFLSEVRRILALLPQDGLVLDVRGNPGGTIPAGEGLLQFFASHPVTPSPLQFRSTRLVRGLVESVPFLQPWRRSVRLSVETGQPFSQGIPLLPAADVNRIGRVYPGCAVLLTDALCYSTTDFLAAGWKDNRIGPIIGTDETTGAGGANVWPYETVRQLAAEVPGGSPFRPLPRGASLTVAARRSLRVGESADLPVEGLGVTPDILFRLTRDDLLHQDRDLLAFAATVLAEVRTSMTA